MEQRIGKYISGTGGLNLTITPYEQRPDAGELAVVVTAINGLTAQVKRLADHLGAA
jgi:hypothetical protein